MPGCPRSELIDENEVGTYHCFNRCVRQQYLLGQDFDTGKNYDVRKDWLRQMLIQLAAIFAIDIFKYAVQDNHFHLILRNRPDLAHHWTDAKVLRRALQLFPEKFRRLNLFVTPEEQLPKKLLHDHALIAEMRRRLSSISWLMKILEERIAKRANRIDGVVGAFWEGRFKCEALLDEAAVLACAVYLDLNLIRSGKYQTPEQSVHTSAYDRIRGLQARRRQRQAQGIEHDGFLCPLNTTGDYANEDLAAQDKRASNQGLLELPLEAYLECLDHTGRELREGKRGAIPATLAPIFERLGFQVDFFTQYVETFGKMSRRAVGSVERLRQQAERLGRQWLHGVSCAQQFFTAPSAPASG